jgi:hypothetical protein
MHEIIIRVKYITNVKILENILNTEVIHLQNRDNKNYDLIAYKFNGTMLTALVGDEISKPSLKQRRELYDNNWVLM